MKPTWSIEKITPEMAYNYLQTSRGNRALRDSHVAGLVSAMKRGDWKVNNNSITFDDGGHLIDGHHRLYAIIAAFVTVEMGVLRGVTAETREVIDTGEMRSVADMLSMNATTEANKRASYLRACARLVTGTNVAIKTIPAYESWLPFFKEGMEMFFEAGGPRTPHMLSQKVAGPIIVAFKINPEAITKFVVAVRDGVELRATSPALSLREFLKAEVQGDARARRQTFDKIASKVFACAKAYIDNRPLVKIQASETAAEYFRSAYSRGNIGKLITETRVSKAEARTLMAQVQVTSTGVTMPAFDELKGK